MDENLREQMVSAIVDAARVAGSKDYEEGMRKAKKLVEFAYIAIQSMQTVDGLRAMLDTVPSVPEREEQIVLFMMSNLPQLIRLGLNWAAKRSAASLPTLQAGRPQVLGVEESQKMLDFVSQMHRKGSSLKAAKLRASQKFRCSQRTVERVWGSRESVPERKVTLEDVIAYFAQTE